MDGSTHIVEVETSIQLPIGTVLAGRVGGSPELLLDLGKLLSGRLLVQGSSGAGKSRTLRKLIEEAFEYVTVIIVDPEGEFGNLAEHIGATSLRAVELTGEGLTAAAVRSRKHRLPLHLDLTDLSPDERIQKSAAFFAGLVDCHREDWAHTVLVAIDEAHLLAPHLASSARDKESRSLGVAALTDLCARGRKRGIATVVATQRLAKLAGSVISELHNGLLGLNIFDRDVARAADLLGFTGNRAGQLRDLKPGEFFAFGPALCSKPLLVHVHEPSTRHLGATPDLVGPAELGLDEAAGLLDLGALRETGVPKRDSGRRSSYALDTFLLDPAAGPAVRIFETLRKVAPNATTAEDLARHLGLQGDQVDGGLDLLGVLGAADTMPRGEARIARLSARLRVKTSETPVVGLA